MIVQQLTTNDVEALEHARDHARRAASALAAVNLAALPEATRYAITTVHSQLRDVDGFIEALHRSGLRR